MAFTADPFAYTGTVDTTGSGGPTLTFIGAHDTIVNASDADESEGRGEGTSAPETSIDNSVASVCPAVRQPVSAVFSAAATRLQPTQRSFNRTY